MGWVYVIRGSSGLYKIGQTIDLDNRFGDLPIRERPYQVVRLLESPEYREIELGLHDRFVMRRRAGEWFALERNDVSEILGMTEETAPKRQRNYRKPPTYLKPHQRDALLAATAGNLRDRAILTLMCYTGLRLNETCMLDRRDIDFAERTVLVRFAKGGKWRKLGLPSKAAATLAAYLSDRRDDDPALFLSNRRQRVHWRTVQELLKRYVAVVPELAAMNARTPITPHVLRHTFATSLLRATKDLQIVQHAMGHTNIQTTSLYLHLEADTLRDAMDLL